MLIVCQKEMQCFCKKNIAQVLLNAEFNDLATLCVKKAAAERRGREAALIARRQPASRWPPRVLRSPRGPRRGPFPRSRYSSVLSSPSPPAPLILLLPVVALGRFVPFGDPALIVVVAV